MFRPNQVGKLLKNTGYDKYAQVKFADPIDCPFAVVSLLSRADKTNVRADSSASRGSADEILSKVKILIVPTIKPGFDDVFIFNDTKHRITGVHPRYTVTGTLDHYEADLEVTP